MVPRPPVIPAGMAKPYSRVSANATEQDRADGEEGEPLQVGDDEAGKDDGPDREERDTEDRSLGDDAFDAAGAGWWRGSCRGPFLSVTILYRLQRRYT